MFFKLKIVNNNFFIRFNGDNKSQEGFTKPLLLVLKKK